MKKILLPTIAAAILSASCTKTENTQTSTNDVLAEGAAETKPEAADTSRVPKEPVTGQPGPETAEHNNDVDTAPPGIPKGPTDGVVTTEGFIYSDYPSDNLPMEKLTRTITSEDQVVYVKVQNAKKGEILNVKVEHEKADGNIYIPHVYGPGVQDGPFGQSASYTVPKDGDYTFAFNKNKRAEGSQLGNILITLTKK